jgi:FtsH-binding integral membrane protein
MNDLEGLKMTDGGGAGLLALKATKFWALMPALLGAAIMAMTSPPKDRRQLFVFAAVALGTSFLFGSVATAWAHDSFEFLQRVPAEDVSVAVHGFLGASAWGLFGALAKMLHTLREKPLETLEYLKNIFGSR